MATQVDPELSRFRDFIVEKLTSGDELLTPEEALDLWRLENPVSEEFAETVAALRQSLADVQGGDRGITLEEFDRMFREKHGLRGAPQ